MIRKFVILLVSAFPVLTLPLAAQNPDAAFLLRSKHILPAGPGGSGGVLRLTGAAKGST
jgi:hypothetical protein